MKRASKAAPNEFYQKKNKLRSFKYAWNAWELQVWFNFRGPKLMIKNSSQMHDLKSVLKNVKGSIENFLYGERLMLFLNYKRYFFK